MLDSLRVLSCFRKGEKFLNFGKKRHIFRSFCKLLQVQIFIMASPKMENLSLQDKLLKLSFRGYSLQSSFLEFRQNSIKFQKNMKNVFIEKLCL